MCIGLLAKQDFYVKYIFQKTGLKKLANSQNFANSQPGAKFSTFPEKLLVRP